MVLYAETRTMTVTYLEHKLEEANKLQKEYKKIPWWAFGKADRNLKLRRKVIIEIDALLAFNEWVKGLPKG